MSTLISRGVAASSDDCEYLYDTGTDFSTNDNYHRVGYTTTTYKKLGCGFRFLNIDIPPLSNILSASFVVVSAIALSLTAVNTRIRAERNINAATFSDLANYLARIWTTEYVNWDNIPAWAVDAEYESPDISSCVQEVIDLPGWESGNSIAFMWDDYEGRSTQATTRMRAAWTYDYNSAKAPKLYITYAAVGSRAKAMLLGVGH